MSIHARECTHSHLTCLSCGSHFNLRDFDIKLPLPKIMQRERLCFTCAFWKDKINNPLPNRQIIDGAHYTFSPWAIQPQTFIGHGGQVFHILLNDGAVIRSNNVWCQGEIPERFRSMLPNTARFITKKAYNKLKSQPLFKCQSKGCWDRYHCFWYDMTLEENGAWNKIPNSHKVGDECCESFLDKSQVFINRDSI